MSVFKLVSLVFRIDEKLSADFKLRLRYDNLSQGKFFAGIADLYLKNDPDILKVLHKIKQNNSVMGAQKLKRTKKDFDSAIDTLQELGITESEKQDIFDLIEMDLEEHEQ